MREYELIIDEAFRNGLSPVDGLTMNAQLLNECYGFRVGPTGLEGYKVLENPLPPTITMHYSWPFPQYITGERYNFLIIRDSITNHEDLVYIISDDHSTVTHISTIAELFFGIGTLMEVADFGEYALLTNGVALIYWDPDLAAWVTSTATATIPLIRTICNFKGQAIGGNVQSAWYDCDETFIIWSKIGELNFTPEQDNEAGYRRDPYGGTIHAVRRLSDKAIVYSSKGITAMIPVGEPASTFAFQEVANVGIINQGAVNGSLYRHIYVGSDYRLYEITNEGRKQLGYQQYIEDLQHGDIIVSYEPSHENFYISDGTKTFMLSPHGLSEVPQHPSAIWHVNNESHMLPDTVDPTLPHVRTSIFDMGYRGLKTIFSLESDATVITGPKAGVDWAHNLNTWGTGPYITTNDMGITTSIASGNMFMFKLQFTQVYDLTLITRLKARYKMTDLRGIRGVKAPPPRGQSYAD